MRTLTLSIGNTSILAGVFSNRRLERAWRSTAADLALELVRVRGALDRAVVCSVVPSLTDKIAQLIRHRWRIDAAQLTATSDHGLRIGYRDPAELGADRVAAALGAVAHAPRKNLLLVDCGTATTITAVRSDRVLLGGAILPGLALWPEMLAARTAQLPSVAPARPRTALGRTTREGMASGIYFGHLGAIREVVTRLRAEAFGREPVRIIGTGGNAALFAREKLFARIEPHLVLEGLLGFAEREFAV